MKTGRVLWTKKFADWKEGYYSTGAPIVANGVLISGMAGGESTTRGFLDGWDPDTGEKLWRRYTIPAPGEPGSETWPANSDAWKYGGGADLALGLLRSRSSTSSTGAPAMPSPTIRGRAAVSTAFTRRACSRSGRRPARSSATTSTRRTTCTTWTAPTNSCSPTCRSTARPRKVMIQSNKNGFMYVVDRTNCKLIAAHPTPRSTGRPASISRPAARSSPASTRTSSRARRSRSIPRAARTRCRSRSTRTRAGLCRAVGPAAHPEACAAQGSR